MSKKTILIAVLLATAMVFCVLPSAVSAADRDHPNGHRHTEFNIYKVPGGETTAQSAKKKGFPAALDPRGEAWFQNVAVRDQADTELCWAFSTMAAAQASYAKETGDPSVMQLSPSHLGYFMYNRVNDPQYRTEGDRNIDPSGNWIEAGGASYFTFNHLATWSGAGAEANTPFTISGPDASGNTHYTGPTSFDPALAYNDALVQQNCVSYHEADEATVKDLVTTYGSAVVSIESSANYYTGDDQRYFYNNRYAEKNNHEVLIVGWDDSVSASNFQSEDSKTGQIVSPSRDGAWIVMNSWGTEWGDNGFFYVSYQSKDILSDGIAAYDMRPADPSLHLYQYDGNANPSLVEMLAGEKAANVFTADSQITLKEVGMTEYNDGSMPYTLDVYTDLADPRVPDSGLHAASQSISTDTPGFKSIELDTPVAIDPGESWSIVITYHKKAYAGIESAEKGSFVANLKKGESFYYTPSSKEWTDAAKYEFCIRIKGIAADLVCPNHQYQSTGTVVAPTKNSEGYTVSQCSACGHLARTDIQPMLDPVPKKTSLKSVKKGTKSLKVTWKKSSEIIRGSHITGYQIRYSQKSSMKSAKKSTIKGYNKSSKTIKGLKKGKKYYVQVRTYYKDSDGVAWYSSWSSKKAQKTK